jgi:HD-like signal output (HDOD) protein
VLRVINSSWASVEDLVAALEREPGVGDRVLSAARSAVFARAGAPVTTLDEAVRLLGLTRLRELLQRWDDSRS